MTPSVPQARPTTVLIVDDHPLIRSALKEALSLALERTEVLEASNPEEGLALLGQRSDVDLVVLDLNFSQHNGLAFITRYRTAAPAAPLVIYTMHEDAVTLNQALALGAAGVIPKTHSRSLLQKAIGVIMEGGIYVPPLLARGLSDEPRTPSAVAARSAMTAQQWKILELLAQGAPNKEIARKLGIASSTVKNQLTVIFQRLGVSNRTQAAIAARVLVTGGAEAARGQRGSPFPK
jgi:DNA-binding NarL/FixJ family response regulator